MQTFLPYPDFERTAEVLDDRRLGKQRVEVLQILNAMHRTSGGWVNHPATRMWRGYEPALVAYGLAVIDAWTRKGRADTVREKILPHLHGEPVRTQRGSRRSGCCRRGSVARTCTAPIARRWCGRCPSTTARCSPTSRTTSRTSGRRDRTGRSLEREAMGVILITRSEWLHRRPPRSAPRRCGRRGPGRGTRSRKGSPTAGRVSMRSSST